MSIYFEKPSPFLSKIIQRPWKLSTSQVIIYRYDFHKSSKKVPPDQTNMKTEDSRGEDLKFTSGGFGAVILNKKSRADKNIISVKSLKNRYN